jgi:TusA-related sulfurtransferase
MPKNTKIKVLKLPSKFLKKLQEGNIILVSTKNRPSFEDALSKFQMSSLASVRGHIKEV